MASELVLSGGKWVLQAAAAGGVQWIDIEDLGAFPTSSDPDSRLTSYSYNSSTKVHTFDLVTLPNNPSGYFDYSVASTLGTLKQPRWSKTLVDENGVALTTDDEFTLMVRMDSFSPGTMQNWTVMLGHSRDNTSTTKSAVYFTGTGIGYASAGSPTGQCCWVGTNNQVINLANADTVLGQSPVCGTGRNRVGGTMITLMSPTSAVQTSRTGAASVSATTPLYLEVMCPTVATTTFTTGGAFSVKIRYAIVRS